jgi:hypothetical protein
MNDASASAAVRSRLTEVHESLTDVHMGVPVGDILDRARRRRTRRRNAGLAVAAGTGSLALAGALLIPGGVARTAATNPAQLTAWTVSRQPNGEIKVTIRELKDPAGLQRELRADGVPASVRFGANPNRACKRYPARQDQLARVYPVPYGAAARSGHAPPEAWHQSKNIPARLGPQSTLLFAVIRPSALPRGTGVQITSFSFSRSHGRVRKAVQAHPKFIEIANSLGLVYSAAACTGS